MLQAEAGRLGDLRPLQVQLLSSCLLISQPACAAPVLVAWRQCLLPTVIGCAGTHPYLWRLQTLAAQQALRLLAVSLQDLHVLHTTMALDSCLEDAKTVTEVLSHADARAEEVSRIVRCASWHELAGLLLGCD